MNKDLYLGEKGKTIAYVKPKNKIVIYNDFAFGLSLYCTYEDDEIVFISEEEIENYNCEVVDLTKGA
jgi:hypothetical protein